ncbi:MAG: hypothetical protein AAFO94_03820, partial [Bacteroidota bacterium]
KSLFTKIIYDMRSKNYSMGVGNYYFKISASMQNIMIKRTSKAEAIRTFLNYKKLGKSCEWLGKWEGKKFSETTAPVEKAA